MYSKKKKNKTENRLYTEGPVTDSDSDSIIITRENMRERSMSFRDPDPPILLQNLSKHSDKWDVSLKVIE